VDPHADGTLTLAIVEVLDRDGRARVTLPVRRWPIAIGRAVSCDLVLDDPYVAPHHATLTAAEGGLQLTVGETVNGVWVRKRRAAAGERVDLQAGDTVQVGGTRLRVRLAADALAPERPWVPEASGRVRTVVLLTLAMAAWTAVDHWLRQDPGGRLSSYSMVVLAPVIALAIWSGLWAIGSKLVRHRFDFPGHAQVALLATLAMSLTTLVLPVAAFMSGWSWPSRIATLVDVAILWGAVAAHIRRIFPGRPRLLGAVMATLFAIGTALYAVQHYESEDRVFPELYVATLAPPALRMAPTVPTARFVEEARALKAVLEAHVADDDSPDAE
jgi:pSer/pThr/pTyr-binding forkhead associated (FHA) protein